MRTINERIITGLQMLFGVLVLTFYGSILYFAASSILGSLWSEGIFLYKINHLETTNCTILRASVAIGDSVNSWFIHVNYNTSSSSSNFGEPHVTLLQGTDIDTLYTVNSTIPCFYSTFDLSYATLYNGGASAVDIMFMIFYAAISMPFILIPVGGFIYLLSLLLPYFVVLRSVPEKATQLGTFVTKRSVEIMRKWKRFVPLAQSDEEAFSLESTDDVIIGSSRDSPV
jgi:hypothetical protein